MLLIVAENIATSTSPRIPCGSSSAQATAYDASTGLARLTAMTLSA